MRKRGPEFLLVQTRSGRWIFPKGGVERGLTHAQSAALEAFEEAGVHGRIEQIPFTRYFRKASAAAEISRNKKKLEPITAEPAQNIPVFLCEVARLETPQEANRNPTWFTADKAKQRLAAGRASDFARELSAVVDRARMRIARLQKQSEIQQGQTHRDPLQEVRFEGQGFSRYRQLTGVSVNRAGQRVAQAIDVGFHDRPLPGRAVLQLGAGLEPPSETASKVTAIDSRIPKRRRLDKKIKQVRLR